MKKLKKLELKKEKFYEMNKNEQASTKGGLFGSRVTCFQTKSDRGCTSHTRCTRRTPEEIEEDKKTVTIFCINF